MTFKFISIKSPAILIFAISTSVFAQENSNQNIGFGSFFGKIKEISGAVVENIGKHVEINVNSRDTSTTSENVKLDNFAAASSLESQPLEVYRTIDGSTSKLNNIFNETNKEDTSITKKEMGWPRVAISFSKWGSKLNCWQGRAEIWSDSKSRTFEDFEACNVKFSTTDDIGRKSYFTDHAEQMGMGVMQSYKPHYNVKNTGENRTSGPTPPLNPLFVNIANDGTKETSFLILKLNKILLNIGLHSGFLPKEIFSSTGGITVNKLDARLWFYKFDLKGRVD